MSRLIGLDFYFDFSYEPGRTVRLFLDNGWSLTNEEGYVIHLKQTDIDDYDWQSTPVELFDIDKFIRSHKGNARIGISVHWSPDVELSILVSPDNLDMIIYGKGSILIIITILQTFHSILTNCFFFTHIIVFVN